MHSNSSYHFIISHGTVNLIIANLNSNQIQIDWSVNGCKLNNP